MEIILKIFSQDPDTRHLTVACEALVILSCPFTCSRLPHVPPSCYKKYLRVIAKLSPFAVCSNTKYFVSGYV